MSLHLPWPNFSSTTDNPRQGPTWRRWGLLAVIMLGVLALGAWGFTHLRAATTNPAGTATVSNPAQSSAATVSNINSGNNGAPQPPASAPAGAPARRQAQPTPATTAAEKSAAITGIVAISGVQGTELWAAPGANQLTALPTGVVLTALGRTEANDWLWVRTSDGATGWVETSAVIVFNSEELPVLTPAEVTPTTNQTTTVANTTAVTPTVTANPTTTVPAAVGGQAAAVAASTPNTTTTASPVIASSTAITGAVTTGSARLNVRAGPGTTYAIVAKVTAGAEVTALARNEAGDWIQIALPDDATGFGWVSAAYVRLDSAVSNLPVSDQVSAAPAIVAPVSVTAAATIQTVSTTAAATAVSTTGPTGLHGKLVFQSEPGGTIYVYDLDRGSLRPLTHGFDPAISPDGSKVTFTRIGGENGVYLINIDGSGEHAIFTERSSLASPKWSPDGNWIVFQRGDEYIQCRNVGRTCLTDEVLLAQNPNFPLNNYPLVKEYESNLARVDVNGHNYRDLPNLESATSPDWSTAGIVYASKSGLQITADTPDNENHLVAFEPLRPRYRDPDWQPNGGRIVYMTNQGSHHEIFAINPDGTGQTALTRPVTTLVDALPSNVAPAWSPDGQHIVFLSNRNDSNSVGPWRIWVMNADGSNQHPLAIDVELTYNFTDEQTVSWGP
ncbi:MAG: SH3 domain-containing protein [Caldilineaceae bacterium]